MVVTFGCLLAILVLPLILLFLPDSAGSRINWRGIKRMEIACTDHVAVAFVHSALLEEGVLHKEATTKKWGTLDEVRDYAELLRPAVPAVMSQSFSNAK